MHRRPPARLRRVGSANHAWLRFTYMFDARITDYLQTHLRLRQLVKQRLVLAHLVVVPLEVALLFRKLPLQFVVLPPHPTIIRLSIQSVI